MDDPYPSEFEDERDDDLDRNDGDGELTDEQPTSVIWGKVASLELIGDIYVLQFASDDVYIPPIEKPREYVRYSAVYLWGKWRREQKLLRIVLGPDGHVREVEDMHSPTEFTMMLDAVETIRDSLIKIGIAGGQIVRRKTLTRFNNHLIKRFLL
jgi:hypothetical protein